MKLRGIGIVMASLALALTACTQMAEKPKVGLPQVAGVYEGDITITATALEVTVSVPIRLVVTQDGANVTITPTSFLDPMIEGPPIIGEIDKDGKLTTITGDWTAQEDQTTDCGVETTTGISVSFNGNELRLSASISTETCGTSTVTMVATKERRATGQSAR